MMVEQTDLVRLRMVRMSNVPDTLYMVNNAVPQCCHMISHQQINSNQSSAPSVVANEIPGEFVSWSIINCLSLSILKMLLNSSESAWSEFHEQVRRCCPGPYAEPSPHAVKGRNWAFWLWCRFRNQQSPVDSVDMMNMLLFLTSKTGKQFWWVGEFCDEGCQHADLWIFDVWICEFLLVCPSAQS